MKNGFKCACVFIGTVIGAGFATGREVALYFDGLSPLIAFFAGLIIGGLGSFFMFVGKITNELKLNSFLSPKLKKVVNAVVFLCAYITFVAMFAGTECIISEIFHVSNVGIISAVLAIIIAILGIRHIKFLNIVIVPLIMILVAVIFLKNKEFGLSGKFSILNPIAYATMNIMLAGFIMTRLGATAKKNEIITAGIISGLVLGLMLFMILSVVNGDRYSSMPLYTASVRLGIGRLAGCLIFFAIFTTLVSSANILVLEINEFVNNKWVSGLISIAVSWPCCMLFTFDQIVDNTYPFISAMGVIFTIALIIRYTKFKMQKFKYHNKIFIKNT